MGFIGLELKIRSWFNMEREFNILFTDFKCWTITALYKSCCASGLSLQEVILWVAGPSLDGWGSWGGGVLERSASSMVVIRSPWADNIDNWVTGAEFFLYFIMPLRRWLKTLKLKTPGPRVACLPKHCSWVNKDYLVGDPSFWCLVC